MDEQQRRLIEELLFSEKKKPSFVKQLYFGKFDSTHIFPYPEPSEEIKVQTESFLKKVKAFVDENVDPDWIDRNATVPDNVVQGLARLGVLGMTVPKEYGGLGMGYTAYCKLTEMMAGHCASTTLLVNVHQSIGLKSILLFGTDKQKKEWLPPLAAGEKLAAFSLTEPNAGSDASAVETRATYDPDKKAYRINGQKQWTTNGSIAKVLTVMAQTEIETKSGKQDKITAFLVTPDMTGFSVLAPALEKVGMRGTKTANLAFRDMVLPAENVLGPLGGGLRVCLTILDYGRTTFGASCTGAAKTLLQKAIQHARTRHQFKRPLASFGLVKEKIGRMAALTYAMDATTYMTAGLIDAGVEDIMLESAILKVFASEALWSIVYETMQIHGGRSLFTSDILERAMRDARLNMIGEGANEVMRAFVAAVGMRDIGMELKGIVDAIKNPWGHFGLLFKLLGRRVEALKLPEMPEMNRFIQPEVKALRSAIRRFSFAVIKTLGRYREDIVEHQLVLNRLATCVIALYTTTSVLCKLDNDLLKVKGDQARLGNDVAIAKFYCKEALRTLNCKLSHLFDPHDDAVEHLSDLITNLT